MARGTVRIRGETNIRALAERLFDLSGGDADAKARMAEKALLRANPGLRSREGFQDGRLVIVPAIGLGVREEEVDLPAADLDGLLRETADRLDEAGSEAASALQASVKAAERNLHRLADEKFVQELIGKAPEQGAKLVEQAKVAIDAQAAVDKARQRQLKQMIEQASVEIDRLRKLAAGDAGGGTPPDDGPGGVVGNGRGAGSIFERDPRGRPVIRREGGG